MSSFLNIISFAFIPVAAAILGSVIATFRPPSPIARSYIQHLAAGVVFSVVAVELLPDITRHHNAYLEVTIGFLLGVGTMVGLRTLSHKLESKNGSHSLPVGLLVGVAVDILLDGFLIGVAFAAGDNQGRLLTLALTMELLSLGLAVASALGKTEKSKQKIILTTVLLFPIIVVGAGLGAVLVQSIPPSVMEEVLSFGLAALLYLVTEELLVEAHKEPESPMATATFFIGFLVFLLLGMKLTAPV